jgi:hypothetical protein
MRRLAHTHQSNSQLAEIASGLISREMVLALSISATRNSSG